MWEHPSRPQRADGANWRELRGGRLLACRLWRSMQANRDGNWAWPAKPKSVRGASGQRRSDRPADFLSIVLFAHHRRFADTQKNEEVLGLTCGNVSRGK